LALAKSHEFLNLFALPGFLYFLPKETYLPFILGYTIGTFFLSPDLDLKHSKPTKRWKFLKIIWYPYQKVFKHRGLSHIPILGTFLRLFYLMFVLTLIYIMLYLLIPNHWKEGSEILSSINPLVLIESIAYKEWAFYTILGLLASELMHTVVDVLWSLWVRIRP